MTSIRRLLLLMAVLVTAGTGLLGGDNATAATGTDYVSFWSGDLRIFAQEADTTVTLTDIDTGSTLVLVNPGKDPRINTSPAPTHATNPFTLVNAGD